MSDGSFDARQLAEAGFVGFVPIHALRLDRSRIPEVRGVYAVLRLAEDEVEFLPSGSGGHFKGKNPNVDTALLRQNWVPKAQTVYIGKAGDPGKSATLRSRLWQYLRFGAGANVGHWGGRYIWQLSGHEDLVIAWKELPVDVPSEVESALIAAFRNSYGVRPFANLAK